MPAVLAVWGACIALSACGGGGGGGSSSDTTAPAVVATTAPNGATNVDPVSVLRLTFSEDLNPATVNGLTIALVRVPGGAVTGVVTASGASGTFSQTRPLALKTQYTLLATTGVRDVAGNAMTAPYTTSFTTRDGVWTNAQLIENNNAGNASVPQVAFDANGNAIAVWQQHDGSRNSVWTNRYSEGSWGTPRLLESDDTGDAESPQIAIDSSGNAIAVWQQWDGVRISIFANRYSGGSWGSALPIETDNAGNAAGPKIAIDGNGNATVVWYQSDGARANIWSNRYSANNGWGSAQLIESDNAGSALNPEVAVDVNGNAMAVWQQSDGTRDNIWANRSSAGIWGAAVQIETDNADNARNPRIALDANGNAIAVWFQSDGLRTNISANRYVAGSGWGTAQLIETDNAGPAEYPRIAFDINANATVVWHQSDGTRINVMANRYTSGSGWGMAQLIETDDAGSAGFPRVAADANGNVIAIWQQSDAVRTNIWTNRYVAGTGWGMALLVETDNAGPAIDPQIAIDSDGYAIGVWTQSDGTRYNINAARFR
ncbi:MAG: Ig-like domain-containing protein [Burkholderiales bacterium]